MPTTMLLSLMMTGKGFRWQGGVSNATTQTKSGGLESALTPSTTPQVQIFAFTAIYVFEKQSYTVFL